MSLIDKWKTNWTYESMKQQKLGSESFKLCHDEGSSPKSDCSDEIYNGAL